MREQNSSAAYLPVRSINAASPHDSWACAPLLRKCTRCCDTQEASDSSLGCCSPELRGGGPHKHAALHPHAGVRACAHK